MTEQDQDQARDEAKARVAEWIDDPAHQRELGSADDEATADGAIDVPDAE